MFFQSLRLIQGNLFALTCLCLEYNACNEKINSNYIYIYISIVNDVYYTFIFYNPGSLDAKVCQDDCERQQRYAGWGNYD